MKNNKGFISISVVYSFFLVFIAIVMSIVVLYSSRRILVNEVKTDIRNSLENITPDSVFLKDAILADAEVNGYLYTNTPDFSKVTVDGEYGLYSAQDDLGTSYYFRGDVENNHVKFGIWEEIENYICPKGDCLSYGVYDSVDACEAEVADGAPWTTADCVTTSSNNVGDTMYWRIIRINGDGTIRLIYDGAQLAENGSGHYVGIGYENYFNKAEGSVSSSYTYLNNNEEVDSDIKGMLENWYAGNLKNTYDKYISDSIFCNDREVFSSDDSTINYAAYNRLVTNKNPQLTCTQDADKYTTSTNSGNGLLKYSVGLITADEASMAGAVYNETNDTYYLYNSNERYSYWTMTPMSYSKNYDSYCSYMFETMLGMYPSMGGTLTASCAKYSNVVRPVINLNADVKVAAGDGTVGSPYEILMEGES